jgi:hypothetical protein
MHFDAGTGEIQIPPGRTSCTSFVLMHFKWSCRDQPWVQPISPHWAIFALKHTKQSFDVRVRAGWAIFALSQNVGGRFFGRVFALQERNETNKSGNATLTIDNWCSETNGVFSACWGKTINNKKKGSHLPNGQPWQECTQDQETLRVMLRWYTTVLGFRSTPLYELHPISMPYLPALPWKKEKNRKLARTRQATQFMKQ